MEPVEIITGKTRLLGLIGYPVRHTISPGLHNTLSAALGQDYVYLPFEVHPTNLEKAVTGLQALGFTGFNVTIPYKEEVIKYLDRLSREAELIGAVNTVKICDRKLTGYNTDAEGFARSFAEMTGTGLKNKKMLVIGAGGTARAIAVKAALEGTSKIYIVNRTRNKSENIVNIINQYITDIAESHDLDSIFELVPCSDVIINTTPLGMHPDVDKSPVEDSVLLKILKPSHIVYDVIYNPDKTRLLLCAEKAGCKIVNGLGMLFYQGIHAYEIWTETTIEKNILDEVYQAFLKISQRFG